jgi:hypothetical protein
MVCGFGEWLSRGEPEGFLIWGVGVEGYGLAPFDLGLPVGRPGQVGQIQ